MPKKGKKQLRKERSDVLLRAAYDLLQKQNNSPYVLNLLEESVPYDGTGCDGYCLMEDISIHLDIDEEEL